MPIIDYLCPLCQHTDSHFIPVKSAAKPKAEHSRCSKCGSVTDRDYMVGGPTVGFRPIVVHLNKSTGQYSIPGHPDDPVDKDYTAVHITSMRGYERFRRGMEANEKEKADFLRSANQAYFDDVAKEHRQATKDRMEQAIAKGGYWSTYSDESGNLHQRWAPVSERARYFFDLACKFTDQTRERRRQQLASGAPNIHSRLLEHKSSERSIVDGEAKRAEFRRKR